VTPCTARFIAKYQAVVSHKRAPEPSVNVVPKSGTANKLQTSCLAMQGTKKWGVLIFITIKPKNFHV
jgi:hypothetical protein